MQSSISNLVLAPDSPIDLQIHTTYSDGQWSPEELIDHLVSEQFGLAAITDHERVDTFDAWQQLAAQKHLPVLPAVEMSASWNGALTDMLCFGFDPADDLLRRLSDDVLRRQSENTTEVYQSLRQKGLPLSDDPAKLAALLEKPAAGQPFALAELMLKHGYKTSETSLWGIASGAGCATATNPMADIVDAAQRDGAVCLIAHPGRGGDNPVFDIELLDQLRAEIPIDGFEAYYPLHTPEQTAMYVEYARKYGLLTSSGSDSHGLNRKPIKYRADLSRALLARLGIQVQ